jgi:hypothetical protein
MTADPNMRCVCGYRIFRDQRITITEPTSQWVLFDNGAFEGFGSTPYGTYFGSGSSGTWGLFEVDVSRTHKQLVCESCARVRSDVVLSGIGFFGSYLLGDSIFVLVTDTTLLGCIRIRFESVELGISVDVFPTVYTGDPLPLAAPTPDVTADDPGNPVAGVLRALLPDVDHDGTFVVSLVDVCSGTAVPLANIPLESAVQIHYPHEADLNGMPSIVIEQNVRAYNPVSQPGTSSVPSIPFDKCDVVIEYDARFGQLPGPAGFTNGGGGGTYTLVDGGVLSIITGGTSDKYFKEVTLGAAFSEIHMYAQVRTDASTEATANEGLHLLGDGAPGASGSYLGMQMRSRIRKLAMLTLDEVTANPLPQEMPASGWWNFYSGLKVGASKYAVALPALAGPIDPSSWGTGSAGGVNPTVRMTFGDLVGSTLQSYLRNMVVSCGGRFVRAFFRSYAAAAAPVLRLSISGDVDAGPGTTVRFRVRYGSLGPGASPYSLGAATIVEATANFSSKNVVVEVPFQLTGLVAKAPFWFSVERAWENINDTMPGTAHLIAATVRSS